MKDVWSSDLSYDYCLFYNLLLAYIDDDELHRVADMLQGGTLP